MGISDVGAFMRAIPKWWRPLRYEWVTRVGDAEGNATLNKAISPIYHIDRIQAPLMIGQGANDPRVRQAESDRIAGALSRRGAAVTCACVWWWEGGLHKGRATMQCRRRRDRHCLLRAAGHI